MPAPGYARRRVSDHLSDDDVARLAAGTLSRQDSQRFNAHAMGCDDCSARLERALATSSSSGAPTTAAPAPASGAVERIDRYILLGEVGRGGMGRVFRAFDPRLERTVAVKLLRAERQDARDRAQLIGEAQTLAKLSHPNLVTVFDAGEANGTVFLAMEYLQGETLAEWLEQKRPLDAVLRAFREAGEGLAAAHAAGLVHRDFKPSNVLLHKGLAKVTDLGLARAATQQAVEVAGTAAYMAPEQREGRFDERSDQFAFGVALAEALKSTGARVPSWLEALTARARAPRPEDRFPSMRALLDALEADPVRRRRRVLAVAAVVLFVVSLGGALGLAQQRRLASCSGGDGRVAAVFGADVRAAVKKHLDASFPAEAAKAQLALLDGWAASWRTLRRDVCVATRVRGEQSDELFTLKTLCLDRQMAHFAAVVERTAAGGVGPEALVSALADLPRVAGCDDGETLVFHNASETPAARRAAQPVREQLDRAVALSSIGKDEEAGALVADALEKARATKAPPLLSEALVLEGQLEARRGEAVKARERFVEGYRLAAASRHDSVAARAATELMVTWGTAPETMAAVRGFAEAALERAGRDDDSESMFRFHLAQALFDQAHYEEAEREFRRCLELRSKVYGPDAPPSRSARVNLAMTLERQQHTDEALALYKEILAADEAQYGPQSAPAVRSRVTWAAGMVAAHRYDAALPVLEQARRELEKFGAVETDSRFTVIDNLASVLEARRRWKEALALREELRTVSGEDDFLVALTQAATCRVKLELGERDAARELAEAAQKYFTAANADHPSLVVPLTVLGRLEKSDEKARALLEHAVKIGADADAELLADAELALSERVAEPRRAALREQAKKRYTELGLSPPR